MTGLASLERKDGCAWLLAIAVAICPLSGAAAAPAFDPPEGITVVTDVNYPPYLFQTEDGRLQGILKDKWDLWSAATGVTVQLKGMEWSAAQEAVQTGAHDVIDTLSFNARRAGLYEFSAPYTTIEARIYFHRTVTGVGNDVATLRGFEIGAKSGSACAAWLAEAGIAPDLFRWYPDSEALVKAAGAGEVRLFCMDAPAARYLLFRLRLDAEFRESPALYSTRVHWAVQKGRPELRDFIQSGFARIGPLEMQAIEDAWLGSPLRLPIAPRYWYYLSIALAVIFAAASLLMVLNWSLRRRVVARTAELNSTLVTLREHAARVHDLYNSAPCGYQSLNADGLIVDINDTELRWLGLTREETVGKIKITDMMTAESRRAFIENFPHFIARGSARDVEHQLVRRDGSIMTVLVSASAVRDPDGKFVMTRSTVYDITDRKRAERALDAERALLKSLVDNLPDHVFSMDRDGRYTMANPAWLEGSGFRSQNEILGKTVHDILTPHLAARAETENRRIAQSGIGVYDVSVEGRAPDGSTRWVLLTKVPLIDKEGRYAGLIGVRRDVTRLKQAADELARERNLLRSVIDHVPDGIYVKDLDLRYVLLNEQSRRRLGAPRMDDVIGGLAGDFMSAAAADAVEREDREVMRSGQPLIDRERQGNNARLGERWLSVTKIPLRDTGGAVTGMLAIVRDTTPLRTAADELARERNLLRSVLDHAPDAIFVKDLEGRYVTLNQEGLRRLGAASMDAVIGRIGRELVPRERLNIGWQEDQEVMRSGVPMIDFQRKGLVDTRAYNWYSITKIPLRDADGKVTGLLSISRDITDLRSALERVRALNVELERERNLLRSIFDNAPVEIFLKDRALRYVLLNDEALRLVGAASMEEVVGKSAGDFFPVEAARVIEEEDREIVESGQPLQVPRRRRAKDATRWHSLSKVPLRDAEGEVTGLLILNRDITDLQNAIDETHRLNVELEERVRTRTAELEEAVKELKAFSYSVSHDLRAPLRRVSGFLSMLRRSAEERLSASERGMVQRIVTAAQRMDQLIDDMLRLSRVAGQEIHVAEVDLSRLAGQIAAELAGGEPGRAVTVRIAENMRVRADTQLIRIVLENLMGNAWKFTSKTAAAAIEVGVTADEGGTVFYVRDNGAGFDMQYAQRLFGPFQRLHHTDEFPGTGVGLATVARIVRRHGGRIWADARPDHGATFYFTFGAGPADTTSSRAA